MNYDTQTNKTKNKEKNVMFRSFNNNRGFGIEIECIANQSRNEVATIISNAGVPCVAEGYNHSTRDHWKIVTDGSVSGSGNAMEIVSPILVGQDGKLALSVVLSALNNTDGLVVEVNRSCGIHVHHDLTSWRESARAVFANNMNNLVSLIAKYEHCLFKLLPASRQGQWSSPVRSIMTRYATNDTMTYAERTKEMKRVHRRRSVSSIQNTRYCGLNLQNLFGRGSVEFRYHQGSTNFNKLWNWIVFTQAFVETAEIKKSISYTDSMTRISCNSALSRLRCDLGLRKADNCEELKACDIEIKRRYHHYKNVRVSNSIIRNGQ
tara:strand:- start:17232 stop:18194 length:963 start_codon:yes stop_codon:yes gene_type:complete